MRLTAGKYLSLVKFSHTLFALPFAITGFTMGLADSGFVFSWKTGGLVLACMVLARNAAMGFNRLADHRYDRLNPRTAGREIPAGKLSITAVKWFVVINSVLFVTATWFINPLCFYLSPVALLVILGYSYTKRFTALCHFILGTGLGLAPVGAYLAVTESFSLVPVLLGFAVLLWTAGFDIIYALQDEAFDQSQKLHSVPASLGIKKSLILSAFLHFLVIVLIALIGYLMPFDLLYIIGSSVFSILLIYQHTIVTPGDLSRINLAFFTVNGIASLIFGAFAVTGILL